MSAFCHAHSGARDWHAAVDACLAQLRPLPEGANLGFVYVTDAFAVYLGAIVGQLKRATNIGQWVGTVGIGVCATGKEYFDQPGLAVMVAGLPEDGFRLVPAIRTSVKRFHAESRDWIQRARPMLGIVHADPRNEKVPGLIVDLADASGCFLVGGLTASRGAYTQIVGDEGVDGGVSGVLLAGAVPVTTGLSQGCSPIGPKRTITGCQDSVVTTLDGRTALDVFKEDIGVELARELRQVGGVIFAAIPVPGSDTGDYLVRNLVGIDPERGWLAVAAEIGEGDRLMFCRRDRASAAEDLKRMLAQVKRRAGAAVPKGALYYSCVARGPNMFGPDSGELGLIRDTFGDLPLVGFYANGEISHNRLYGYTGVLTLFL
jgi:small ligand-binding sensory domain FIST